MTLERKIIEFKIFLAAKVSLIFEKIATKFFNYPENPGMLKFNPDNDFSIINYIDKLPYHRTDIPPIGIPKTIVQVIFGVFPKTTIIDKHYFEHSVDGYYNFYIENYRNIYFLPDWFSQWLQINFEMSVDTTSLELIREGIFVGLISFIYLMQFRIHLFWFLTINPYTRPWVYIISLTDWVFDGIAGFAPVIFGLDLTGAIILSILGKIADTLNHLVFTMPFLPTEGQPGKLIIDQQLKDVILFRYLPSLWYTHLIPNNLREYWYIERPEIIKFLKKNYGQLNINFDPDRILYDNFQVLTKDISPKLLCKTIDYCHFKQIFFYNLVASFSGNFNVSS